jgi:hypothetical protein
VRGGSGASGDRGRRHRQRLCTTETLVGCWRSHDRLGLQTELVGTRSPDARVPADARIRDDTIAATNARIRDDTIAATNARICDDAITAPDARLRGHVVVGSTEVLVCSGTTHDVRADDGLVKVRM